MMLSTIRRAHVWRRIRDVALILRLELLSDVTSSMMMWLAR